MSIINYCDKKKKKNLWTSSSTAPPFDIDITKQVLDAFTALIQISDSASLNAIKSFLYYHVTCNEALHSQKQFVLNT